MKKKVESDDLLIRFLLGHLSDSERTRLEERFFADDELYEHLLAIEDELRYDYAQGRLSARDRELFEKRHLTSPVERKHIESAGLILREIAKEKALREINVRRESPKFLYSLAAFLGLNSAPMRFAMVAAVLVLLIGSTWLIFETTRLRSQVSQLEAARGEDIRRLREQTAEEHARADQLNKELDLERNQRARLEEELNREREAPQPAVQTLSSILSFVVSPGGLRGEAGASNKLRIPPAVSTVRLQVRPKQTNYESFRATVVNAVGSEIWRQSLRLPHSGKPALVLQVPARLLGDGDYEIVVEGVNRSGGFEELPDSFYFTVVRK
jgi:anti-sigma factor RsiW